MNSHFAHSSRGTWGVSEGKGGLGKERCWLCQKKNPFMTASGKSFLFCLLRRGGQALNLRVVGALEENSRRTWL